MKTSTIVWVLVAIIVIAGGGYWVSQKQASPAGDTGNTPPAGATSTITDNAALYVSGNLLLGTDSNAKVGAHLIGFNGMTLYRYTKDSANVSNCTGQCAVNWPPYVVPSTDALGNIQAGVKGKVGSTNRADGSIQVTYNGSPLYFYIGDKNSGDTTGQNVGGVWFVLKP